MSYGRETEVIGMSSHRILPDIVSQHFADATSLYSIRSRLACAPHVRVRHLRRFDDRLEAHVDGLDVAGEQIWPICEAALSRQTPGILFAAAVVAILRNRFGRLEQLCSLAQVVPECERGLKSAFGWVEQDQLRGIVAPLLSSSDPYRRLIGITACALHRVSPGQARDVALEDDSSALRARALRAAGELGRRDLLPTCLKQLNSEDMPTRFWAAWATVLLGNQGQGLEALRTVAETADTFQHRALTLALLALDPEQGWAWLSANFSEPESLRRMLWGSGVVGDPTVVPWLVQQMAEPATARIAGEAFSLITGLDLAYLDLERKPPEQPVAGPNDNPDDPNVEMDDDDGLPWPNPERIDAWWRANGGRFQAGTRYFMGSLPTREHCLRVLREGFQRQRILAAHHLCLLAPGTVLFEWRAPAARQQRLLGGLD